MKNNSDNMKIKYNDKFLGEIELTKLGEMTKSAMGDMVTTTIYAGPRGNYYIDTSSVNDIVSGLEQGGGEMLYLPKELIDKINELTNAPSMRERIICAAIHYPGEVDAAGKPLIYCGHRHCNILWQSKLVSRNASHQGFITSTGRFVDRKEALRIALDNDQVIDRTEIRGNNLYSEDLY